MQKLYWMAVQGMVRLNKPHVPDDNTRHPKDSIFTYKMSSGLESEVDELSLNPPEDTYDNMGYDDPEEPSGVLHLVHCWTQKGHPNEVRPYLHLSSLLLNHPRIFSSLLILTTVAQVSREPHTTSKQQSQ
jgi:hypothetical protein